MNQPRKFDWRSIKNFDELADFQRQLRAEESYYRMFIFLDAITPEEAVLLWEWCMENSLDIDQNGLIRKRLLRWLQPEFVKNSLEAGKSRGGRTRAVPEALKNYINKHFHLRRSL